MPLPNDSVAANTLPEVTTIPTGKKLIFTDPDTNEGGIITLENLTKQILQNLTSQTFSLDQGTKTLVQALNELNSKAPKALKFATGSDERSIVINVTPGAYKGGSCLLFGRSNPNDLIAAVITLFRNEKNNDIKIKILALDGTTYDTVSDNEKVIITGSGITPYSKFSILSADDFEETSVQIK